MSDKRCYVLLAALLLALALCPHSAAQGQASWPCDEQVVDQAGVLGAQIDRVRAAAGRLEGLGADVRVFTVASTGLNNLDLFVDERVQQCPSWQAPGGGMKGNLVVLAVSVQERQTGLYYGESWSAALDSEYSRILSGQINPRFQSGDFAGGLAAGLEEVGRLIDLYQHPRPTSAPTAQPTAAAAPPAGAGSGGAIVGVALGGLAVAGGGVAAAILLGRRAARNRARQSAREAKLKVASRLLEFDEQLPYLEADIDTLAREFPPAEAQRLRQQLAEAQRTVKRANADYQNLELAGNDPDRAGLSPEEYQGYEASYRELQQTLDEADQATGVVRQRMQALREMAAGLPAALEQAQAAIAQAQAQAAERSAGAANRPAERLLQRAAEKLAAARATAAEKDPEGALALAAEVAPLTEQAATAAGRPAELARRIAEVEALIDTGAAAFEQLAQHYAESSWQTVRGNGTEAENRVDWASEALEEACAGLAASEEEKWREAEQRLQQADAWLDEAVGLIGSIQAQQQSLEKARQEAPQEIQAAQADVDRAAQYISQYDPDIREQMETDLEKARQELAQAAGELSRERPDYLQAVALARQANEAADRILAAARDEHETIERLRRKLSAARRSAESAVSRAGHYLLDHNQDVGRDARQLQEEASARLADMGRKAALAEAQEDLARRQALEEAVALAAEAEALAGRAYSQAERDFRRAEEARWPISAPIFVPTPAPPRPAGKPAAPRPAGGWGLPRPTPFKPSSVPRPSGGGSSRWSPSPSRSPTGGGSTRWGGTPGGRRGGGSSGW